MRATILYIALFCLALIALPSSGKQITMLGSYRVVHSGTVTATAYNSLAGQTDDTPWITAAGTRCREGVIASNFLPMGTKVVIEGFGSRVFTVEDRMNRRYNKRIDIWFRDYQGAMKFGKRKIKYHVLAAA